jgi:hypothetical protein
MSEEDLGYKRPPKASRFKPGISGNPMGRPKRQNPSLAEIVVSTLTMPVQHRHRDRTKSTPLKELGFKAIVNRAVQGNLDAAELVLKIRAHAAQHGDAGVEELRLADWLPGAKGQTAQQKTAEFAATDEAAPSGWWQKPNGSEPDDGSSAP